MPLSRACHGFFCLVENETSTTTRTCNGNKVNKNSNINSISISNKTSFILALISSIISPIAYVGIDIWPLAFVSYVPLILALQNKSIKHSLLLALTTGLISMAIAFYWFVGMLQEFSGFALPFCILFAAIIWLQNSGRYILTAWLYTKHEQLGYSGGIVFSFAFCIAELIYPVLFPWYYGTALHNVPVMIQLADIGGPILISFMVLIVNGAISDLISLFYFRKQATKLKVFTILLGVLLPIASYAYGSYKIVSIDKLLASVEPVIVGMVQSNMPLFNKIPTKEDLIRPYELTKNLVENHKIDLVIWPESGSNQTFNTENYLIKAKQNLTSQLKVPAIINVSLYENFYGIGSNKLRKKLYNTALISDQEGNITGRYDKHILLMFGEYIPFGNIFPALYDLSPNSGIFESGESFEPFVYKGHNIAINICYEAIMPAFINKQVNAINPELLVNLTNDTWYGDTFEPWQHFALAKFRAIEHHKYLVRVTNSGLTGIIDPIGRVTVMGKLFAPEALSGDIKFLSGRTAYSYLGNLPWWLLTVGFVGIIFRRKRFERFGAWHR